MSDLVTLITPTGNRPEAFALCEKYIKQQTYKGSLQWIVIDDGTVATKVSLAQEYYRGPVTWQEGLNTQKPNLTLALSKAQGKYIFVIEDDDYYSPKYIETMLMFLDRFIIAGESNIKYYHIEIPGYKYLQNYMHSSLSATGFRKEAIPLLVDAMKGHDTYFDINFWQEVRKENLPAVLFSDKQLSVGMKGLPGRGGIGVGHKKKDYRYDPGHAKLKDWLGSDANNYIKFTKPMEKKNEASRIQKGSGLNSQKGGVYPAASRGSISSSRAQGFPQGQTQKPKA